MSNDEQYPGAGENELADVPEIPDVPEPVDPLFDPSSDPSYDPNLSGEGKASRGKTGCLVFAILFVLAAAGTGYYFFDKSKTYDKWDAQLKATASLPDGQFEAALRKIMKESPVADVLTQAAFELGKAGDRQAIPELVAVLPRGGALAREAARALGNIGGDEAKKAANLLFDEMNKQEERDKAEYAYALCMLGDTRGLPSLLKASAVGSINRIPEYDPELVARVASTDKLIEIADAKEESIRLFAAKELGFRKDKDPVPALLKLVKDAKQEVAAAAATSLARTADKRAGPALIEMMRAQTQTQDAIMTTITQVVGSPGLEAVYKELKGPDEQLRIVSRLKSLRDPRSKDLLLRALTEAPATATDLRAQALGTLEDLGDKRIAEQMFAKTQWVPATEAEVPDSDARYRENDVRRKAANEAVTWMGLTKPDGAADYLMKVYDANKPYNNSPECAQRVQVDISQLMDAMGRVGDLRFCSIIEPFLEQDERFYFQAAIVALARLKCPKSYDTITKLTEMTPTERKEKKFKDLKINPEFEMEARLSERRGALAALRYLGDPKAAKGVIKIILDTDDDPDVRQEAADALGYLVDDKAIDEIIKLIRDEKLPMDVRAGFVRGLWNNPTPAATAAMMEILEGQGNEPLVQPAAIVVGEAADPALADRLNKLLDSTDEARQRAAAFAIMLGGNTARLDKLVAVLQGMENKLVLKERFEVYQVYLTEKMFDSKAIFKRLTVAWALAKATAKTPDEITWPWKSLVQSLKSGWALIPGGPGGLSGREVRDRIALAVRTDNEYREVAANALASLNERGYLLALQAEGGPQAEVVRTVLRQLDTKVR
ncbi:MAG: HEAT repeat domain-containing protein [Deltaproteobacteria bacterium]|nr:HEAT repeat domain-containing protein [Deltaproteobacteria bacterium]